VAVVEDGRIAEHFAVSDAARLARTGLGRELARLKNDADRPDFVNALEAAYA
jgi:hypothetical protein